MANDRALIADLEHLSWERDEETDGVVHMLAEKRDTQVGLWKPNGRSDTTIEVDLRFDETILVLEGHGRVEVNGGTPIDLRPGVVVFLPKGAHTSWMVDAAFRELWIYS